jgi:hypothetical protein
MDTKSPLADDPFPVELGVLEVQQQGDFEAGNVQVSEHLGDVGVVEFRDHLRINDDLFVYDQIRYKLADELFPIVHRELSLLLALTPAMCQFDQQGVLVELFVKTRLQFIQDGHGCADDFPRDFLVLHLTPFLTADGADFTDEMQAAALAHLVCSE